MKILDLFDQIPQSECFLTEDILWEMANLQRGDTGIKFNIYVSTKSVVGERHGPRIKVSNIANTFSKEDNFVVSISKKPVILAGNPKLSSSSLDDVKDWVILNYEILIAYWNEQYDSLGAFLSDLHKI